MLSTATTLFSQRAKPSPLCFGTFPKRRIGRGITLISRVQCDTAMRGCASRVPLSPGAPARRTRGVLVEGAPPFCPLVRHETRLTGARSGARLTLASGGGRSLHSDPCGKAVKLAKKPTAKNSRPQMALRPRPASLEDARNPISPIRSTGSLPLHLTASDSGLILG